mmetsp:Transcript_27499/g.62307  ORF Transcript_27499/g.62307 Transcript_27499/m.62307 type:complete len:118 (-) Transcript_27499:224-577(-)
MAPGDVEPIRWLRPHHEVLRRVGFQVAVLDVGTRQSAHFSVSCSSGKLKVRFRALQPGTAPNVEMVRGRVGDREQIEAAFSQWGYQNLKGLARICFAHLPAALEVWLRPEASQWDGD